ncbi:tetratricopeptide repeat protein [Amphibacillus xylanus]|uniref:TPR repeat-containing protein n=1 Tax=Amphibacillus xylanus (strain ATCC 51415 / DSM 6626 / JCM 7361 / LMG 17667 / NBRC 15112 / Ep01) TaxID=698758 RepID=K0J2P3_AMPXN|nr:hypothetical protein [Amphibacillus xylanus]BAM46821.1 hypothetical protein AXY_06890 [Amphibacillus xylanus NBRC 15112]
MIDKNNKTTKNYPKAIIPFIPDAKFYFSKGVDAFYKRKFDLALKWIKKATEADPDELLYPIQMSVVYTEMEEFHLANQILTELSQHNHEQYPELYYLMANNYAHLGLLKEAEKFASLYLEKDIEGEFRSESEQLLTLLELGLSEEDDDFDFDFEEDEMLIYQETAFYHIQRHDWHEAGKILTEMIKHFPDYLIAKHQYNYALFFVGKQEEAIRLEEELYKQSPESTHSITNLIVFYQETNRRDQAEALIRKLTNVYPIHCETGLRIAITFAYLGYYKEAYRRFLTLPKAKLRNHLDYFRYFSKTAAALNHQNLAEKIWAEGCKKHSELADEPLPWLK